MLHEAHVADHHLQTYPKHVGDHSCIIMLSLMAGQPAPPVETIQHLIIGAEPYITMIDLIDYSPLRCSCWICVYVERSFEAADDGM
jgi:hypothetical protein